MSKSQEEIIKGLEDGSVLQEAMAAFNNDNSEENLLYLLKLLKASTVWIPFTAVLSKSDEEDLMKTVKEKGEDIVGTEWSNKQTIRLIPDILQSGDEYYFPVFISEKEAGDYGKHFSILPQKFLDAIALARNNQKDVTGIVINAFTEPFLVKKGLYGVIEKIKPIITD